MYVILYVYVCVYVHTENQQSLAWGYFLYYTRDYQDQFISDNSCISVEYGDEDAEGEISLTYGIIQRMYMQLCSWSRLAGEGNNFCRLVRC